MTDVIIDYNEYQKLLGKEPVPQSTAKVTLGLKKYEELLKDSQMTPEEKRKKKYYGEMLTDRLSNFRGGGSSSGGGSYYWYPTDPNEGYDSDRQD
jgi:hypothetical protein